MTRGSAAAQLPVRSHHDLAIPAGSAMPAWPEFWTHTRELSADEWLSRRRQLDESGGSPVVFSRSAGYDVRSLMPRGSRAMLTAMS